MVEHLIVNQAVVGSSPARGAILYVGGRQVIQQFPKLPYVGALPTQRASSTVAPWRIGGVCLLVCLYS